MCHMYSIYHKLPVFSWCHNHMNKMSSESGYSNSGLDLDFVRENARFPCVGDAWTEAEEQCALEFVISNANVPLLLSNRLAAKVQRAATENKSHGSSCLAKQTQRGRRHVKEQEEEREGGRQKGTQRGRER